MKKQETFQDFANVIKEYFSFEDPEMPMIAPTEDGKLCMIDYNGSWTIRFSSVAELKEKLNKEWGDRD